jgi:hypothetical protein
MKLTKPVLVCTCCLIAALVAWSQATDNPARPGILGYLDPQTGAFRPAHPAAQEFSVICVAHVYGDNKPHNHNYRKVQRPHQRFLHRPYFCR